MAKRRKKTGKHPMGIGSPPSSFTVAAERVYYVTSGMDTRRIYPQRALVEESRSVIPLFRLSAIDTMYLIGILILNICLVLPLLTASINGLDSSLVNGECVGP
jgi:hypothetical protein